MSKIEKLIVNNLKMLSLDMIKESGHGNVFLNIAASKIFYVLYYKHLMFEIHRPNYINRDRVLVNNEFLPTYYAANYLFTKNLTIDNLKDFKRIDSPTPGILTSATPGVQVGGLYAGDIVGEAVGIALGKRYLDSLLKEIDKKNNLLDFKTYAICKLSDFMSGTSYEALSFVATEEIKELVYIIINDDISKDSKTSEVYTEELMDRLMALNIDLDVINDNISAIDDAIDDAKGNKRATVILVNIKDKEDEEYFSELPLEKDNMEVLRSEYGIPSAFATLEEVKMEIKEELGKRLTKPLTRWHELKESYESNKKVNEIIDFLELGRVNVSFKSENIKINDNYEEELILSNSKIFNLIAAKSPFILSGSNDNFFYNRALINNTNYMTKENKDGRNILFGERILAMGSVSLGLASLGFKMFISTSLINESILEPFIKVASLNNLDITYIFTEDTFINTYEYLGYHPLNELNNLRSIPNLITFRPTDINEILGTYEIITNYKKPTSIIVGRMISKKNEDTNPKYVLAGAYRVRKEREDANAIIIASGSEVPIALKLATELAPYGLDFRVVSMPSSKLFAMQNEKYQNMLLPSNVKTFTLEYGSKDFWYKYATTKDYILGLDKYILGGTKEELLNAYNLDLDSMKAHIMEIMKK